MRFLFLALAVLVSSSLAVSASSAGVSLFPVAKRQQACVNECSSSNDQTTLLELEQCAQDATTGPLCICEVMSNLSQSCLDCVLGEADQTESEHQQGCATVSSLFAGATVTITSPAATSTLSNASAVTSPAAAASSINASVTPLSSAAAAATSAGLSASSSASPSAASSTVPSASASAAPSSASSSPTPSATAKSDALSLQKRNGCIGGAVAGGFGILMVMVFV